MTMRSKGNSVDLSIGLRQWFLVGAVTLSLVGFSGSPNQAGTKVITGTVSCANLRVGVINWDCSVPASTFFGGFATRALGPAKYRSRTPYYAQVLGADRIDFPSRSLTEYEQEMRYALDAGVDYFAYCWYDPGSEKLPCANAVVAAANRHIGELTRARQLHLQSPLRDQLGLCAVLVTCHPYSDACLRELAETMQLSCYEKIGGRPLVACFMGTWRETVARLKGFCRERGTPEPFVVLMKDSGRPKPEEAEGVDAFSAYSSNAPCATVEELFDSVIDRNTTRARVGRPVIPFFTTGWNPWPRIDNPVPWTGYAKRPYPPALTGDELMAGARRLRQWMNENPGSCVPGQMLVFAWNEFEEGGWICPTKGADGDVDLTRCRDFRRAVDFLKGRSDERGM